MNYQKILLPIPLKEWLKKEESFEPVNVIYKNGKCANNGYPLSQNVSHVLVEKQVPIFDITSLAKWLHDNYDEVAKKNDWETQESTKVEFDLLPAANKQTMLELAERLLNLFPLSKV